MNTIKNKSQVYFMCFFLCLFCSFFSISSLYLNPVYMIGFLIIFLAILSINFTKVNSFFMGYFLYFCFSLLCFFIGLYSFNSNILNYTTVYFSTILYLYCIALGGATLIFGLKIDLINRVKVYNLIFNSLLLFMSFDLITRIFLATSNGDFYDYKWGFFYFDSNFTGLVILLFLMFSLFLKVNLIFDIGRFRFLFLFFLLVGTFSRAAIFAFFISYILLRFAKKFIFIVSMLFLFFAIFVFYKMISMYIAGESFVSLDGSFNSKFYLISVAIDNYSDLVFVNKLFGIGLANFQYYSNGFFAHNILITLFYEFGYIGILLFLLFLLFSYIKIGKDVFFIFLPFFIAGFSLFSAYMPFFFVLLACLYVEKNC